ncbi:MAG: hypothetical protein WC698_05900 [Candidatus Peribacteraceae bacterium]|jgi:hypothetical protein
MKSVNILLKGFNDSCSKRMLERAFRDIEVGICVSIVEDYATAELPELGTNRVRVSSTQLRERPYADVDWNTVTPLDEELIERMRHCEAVYLLMLGRYGLHADIPYEERKRQYMWHLRYWNHVIETKKITLSFHFTLPHQGYDYVIYELCKLKGIPMFYIDRCYIMDAFFLVDEIEEPGKELEGKMGELRLHYPDPSCPVPLTPKFEEYFAAQTQRNEEPWNLFICGKPELQRSFLHKWAGVAAKMMLRKPRSFLSFVLSPQFWVRKWAQHKTALLYDRLTKEADLSKPYIYFPLHQQPEATTCPMGGVFVDQELAVQLLASHLPPGIRLYVKEHPAQGEMCRSSAFYRSLQEIPSVTLVPRSQDTFGLMKNAVAVATITGTAAYEGLFRGTPALVFGHRFIQYAPGMQRIHTSEDCARAVRCILEGREKPSLHDMRLFLKAVEDCSLPYVGGPPSPHESRSFEEKADIMGDKIAEKVRQILGVSGTLPS